MPLHFFDTDNGTRIYYHGEGNDLPDEQATLERPLAPWLKWRNTVCQGARNRKRT